MLPSVILCTATIESEFGALQVGKMELVDERGVEERLAWPSYPEKPEMMVVGLTYEKRGNLACCEPYTKNKSNFKKF
jgi:hypothetical protein